MKNIYRVMFIITLISMLLIDSRGQDIVIFNVSKGNNIRFFLLALSIFSSLGFFNESLKEFLTKKNNENI